MTISLVLRFIIQTDHKPLVSLLEGLKQLDALSPRIQRFRMRLMRYSYTIAHVPGKDLTIADTLSQAPASSPSIVDERILMFMLMLSCRVFQQH